MRSKAAKRLEKWRKAEKLDHTAAAEKLGISQSYYSYLERDEKKPSRKLAVALERRLRIRVSAWDDYGDDTLPGKAA